MDWKDAYNKFPAVPLFKPDSCADPLKWEAYVDLLRKSKIEQDEQINGDGWEFDLDVFLLRRYMERAPGNRAQVGTPEYESLWKCCLPDQWEPREWFLDLESQEKKRETEVWTGEQLFNCLPESVREMKYTTTDATGRVTEHGPYLQQVYPTFFDPGNGFTLLEIADHPAFRDMLLDGQIHRTDRLKIVRAFTALGQAKRTTWREDNLPGPTDFLYVIVVCAGSGKSGGAGAPRFGATMLKAVHGLAEQLGVRRVVLSALPVVVSYYHYTMEYDLVTRSGRSLSYFEARPEHDPYRVGKFLDLYSARKLTDLDFRDPALRVAALANGWTTTSNANEEYYEHPAMPSRVYNPPVPYFQVYQSAVADLYAGGNVPRPVREKKEKPYRPRDSVGYYAAQDVFIADALHELGLNSNTYWIRNTTALLRSAAAAAGARAAAAAAAAKAAAAAQPGASPSAKPSGGSGRRTPSPPGSPRSPPLGSRRASFPPRRAGLRPQPPSSRRASM